MEDKYKDNSNIKSDTSFEGGDNFTNFNHISGGNLFENQVSINSEAEVAKSFTYDRARSFVYDGPDISTEINRILSSYKLSDYHLLLLHGNYFSNIFNFDLEDKSVYFTIKKVLKDAWLNGKSGLLKTNIGTYIGIHIIDIDVNHLTGEINKIKYTPFGGLTNEEMEKRNYKDTNILELTGERIKDCAIMNWGVDNLSAWVIYFPFVRLQNVLIQIMNNHSFIFNKKYVYKIQNKAVLKQEIIKFFSADNPFLLHLEGTSFENRFSIIDNLEKMDPSSFIQFYKELVGIYYAIYGRRNNNDFKQERNLVDEIKLTGESIDIIEKEYQDSFKLFVWELKKIGVNVEIIEQEKEEEKEEKDNEDTPRFNE